MNKKTTVIIAIMLGVVAFLLLQLKSAQIRVKLEREYGAKTNVVVAVEDLLAGSKVESKDVAVKDVPALFAQPGAFGNIEDVIGKVLQVPVKKDEQMLNTKLAYGGGVLSLRVNLGDDRRAITLKVNEEGGVAGLCRPGDLVDVVGVFESASTGVDGAKRNHASVLVEAAPVLAVGEKMEGAFFGQPAGPEDTRIRGVDKDNVFLTIEVSAAQGRSLSLASQIGFLRFMLRQRMNTKPYPYSPPTVSSADKEFAAGYKVIWPSGQPPPGPGERVGP